MLWEELEERGGEEQKRNGEAGCGKVRMRTHHNNTFLFYLNSNGLQSVPLVKIANLMPILYIRQYEYICNYYIYSPLLYALACKART